jgi:hypothetical protein
VHFRSQETKYGKDININLETERKYPLCISSATEEEKKLNRILLFLYSTSSRNLELKQGSHSTNINEKELY